MAFIINNLIYFLVRLINSTYRYRYVGHKNLDVKNEGKARYVFALWHQNIMSALLSQTGNCHVAMVSRSKDGEPVAVALHKLGHKAVRGSSMRNGVDKGGKAAKDEMIEVMLEGIPGAMAVDGPKGPAKKVKAGIIDMAKKTGSPIIPYSTIAASYWSFKSWDEFRFPKPFSKIVCHYGVPIYVGDDDDYAIIKEKVEAGLIKGEQEARKCFDEWPSLSRQKILVG